MCGGCVKRAGECETRDSSGSGQLGSCLRGRPALDVCGMCQADVSSWQLSRRRALRAVSCEPVHAARGQRLVDCCLRVRGGIHKRDTHTRACSHAVLASWTPSRIQYCITETTIAQTPGSEEPEYGIAIHLSLPCRLLQRYYSSHSSDRRAVLLCCCVVVLLC